MGRVVRWLALGLLAACMVLAVVAVRWDGRVQAYLAGPPLGTTRIYAAPTELRAGATVPGGSLVRTLARLGYRPVDATGTEGDLAPGTYRATTSTVDVMPRPSPVPGVASAGAVRVVLRGGRPQFAVECKTGERAISPAVRYCAERTPIPRFFQVHRGDRHYASGKVTVLPFTTFCTELNLP